VTEIPSRLHRQNQYSIFDTYENALDNKQNFKQFFEWYRERKDLENEQYRYNNRNEDTQLRAVRKALSLFFPGYDNLHIQRNPQAMVISKRDVIFNINQLSDGEKCYISLIGDLSRRLAIANPVSDSPLDGNGIVLIDEIELHLHPKWQMEIISKLKQTFTNCQFFITTHSPLIVSDIQTEQVIFIKDGNKITKGMSTYGKLVNDILIDHFEIEEPRSMEVQKQIEKAKDLLQNNQITEFQKEIEQLESLLGRGDLDVIALKIEAFKQNKSVNN
jgi:predicted ATP-binding protein involved in virulence